jgi:heme exporter protein A
MTLLTADNLQLWRGETHVLRGLSFSLADGHCLAVTGANGAGKTSLLRALCGLLPLEDGRVRWRGHDTAGARDSFHAELAYLGHENGLKSDLSAPENLRFAVGLRRRIGSSEIHAALLQVGLSPLTHALPVRQLSAGQRRRVALARVQLLDCALWLLDEPTSNLDADGQEVAHALLRAHVARGRSAIVATHRPLPLPDAALQALQLS